jgi:hypothetical protein
MKIEVGESILYSWLRHKKNCQIVQLNWKISSNWPTIESNDAFQKLMDKIQINFHNPFKKTANVSQLIRQAEIDGLGIDTRKRELHAADIAFHESGLNYGSKKETCLNIQKKYLRTAIALEKFFPKIKRKNIYFISPKITPATLGDLENGIEEIKTFLTNEGLKTKIILICNECFKEEILEEMLNIAKEHSDTSELFLRSLQLIKMFE